MANKKSLDAKAYINGKVNDMREQFVKVTDKGAKKQLVETFRKTTSSDEYQENLAIVNEDADAIRKETREKKGRDITSEEFKDAKTEFYGKDMNLDFGEDFENLDLGKKVDYIFEKFGDTDYAADLIVDLLDPVKNGHTEFLNAEIYGLWNEEISYKDNIIHELLGEEKSNVTLNNLPQCFHEIIDKFGSGAVSIRIILFLADRFVGKSCHQDVFDEMERNIGYWENVSQNTMKAFAKGSARAVYFMCRYLIDLVDDGAITDHAILDAFIRAGFKINFKKVSTEGEKYFIDRAFKTGRVNVFGWDYENDQVVIDSNINLGDGVDVKDYILNSFVKSIGNSYSINKFCESGQLGIYVNYHKEIANILIKMGELDIVKKYIKNFTGLTEEEKEEIMGK